MILGVATAGFFFALTEIVSPAVADADLNNADLPYLATLLPLLLRYPVLTALGPFLLGGIALILGPKDKPLLITAWYLAGAFFIGLWITILVIIPQICCFTSPPLQ